MYETGMTVGVDLSQYGREYQITQHLGEKAKPAKRVYESISDKVYNEMPDEHKPKYAGFMWHADHLGNAAGTFDSTQTTIIWE